MKRDLAPTKDLYFFFFFFLYLFLRFSHTGQSWQPAGGNQKPERERRCWQSSPRWVFVPSPTTQLQLVRHGVAARLQKAHLHPAWCSPEQQVRGFCSLPAARCSVSRQTTVGEGSRVRFYVLHSCVRTAGGHPETDERLRRSLLPTGRWLPAGWMAACPRQRLTYRVKTGSWPLAREREASLSWERVGSVGKRGSVVAASRRRRMACPGECRPRCPVCPCVVVECQLVCCLHCRRN